MHPSSGNFGFMNILMSYENPFQNYAKQDCPRANPNPETRSNSCPDCNPGLCFR